MGIVKMDPNPKLYHEKNRKCDYSRESTPFLSGVAMKFPKGYYDLNYW